MTESATNVQVVIDAAMKLAHAIAWIPAGPWKSAHIPANSDTPTVHKVQYKVEENHYKSLMLSTTEPLSVDYVAMMNPDVAKILVTLMEQHITAWKLSGVLPDDEDPMVQLACAILTQA